jgi:hypothetical protein
LVLTGGTEKMEMGEIEENLFGQSSTKDKRAVLVPV